MLRDNTNMFHFHQNNVNVTFVCSKFPTPSSFFELVLVCGKNTASS